MSIVDAACDARQRRSPGRKPSVQSGCGIGRISVADDRRGDTGDAARGLTTTGSVDALLTELNAPDDHAPAFAGGKLFCELVREYLKDREGEPPIEAFAGCQ